MKNILACTITILAMLLSNSIRADVVVIVNKENNFDQFDHRQLVDIYMGRNLYFPDGSLAIRLDQAPNSETRSQFYRSLVDKSIAQVNAYWARLLFTGRAAPPHALESAEKVLITVRNNKNAIGYIDQSLVDDSIKVIGRVD